MRHWYENAVLRSAVLLGSVVLLALSCGSIVNDYLLDNLEELVLFSIGVLLALLAFVQQWATVDARGKRLRQETAFKMESLKRAFEHLQEFRTEIHGKEDAEQVNRAASASLTRMLELMSNDLFHPRTSPVSWWVPSPDNEATLEMDSRWPPDDNTDMSLTIELENLNDGTYAPKEKVGVAGFAYGSGQTYYLANTSRLNYRTLFPSHDGNIKVVSQKGRIWKKSNRKPPLRSLLSIPILEPCNNTTDSVNPLGVLCVGSEKRRAFLQEDVWFSWLAGRMIRELLVLAKNHPTSD